MKTYRHGRDNGNSLCSRVQCPNCETSRLLYCFDCLEILVPKHHWPEIIRDTKLELPFSIDIVLDEKRSKATGIHVATLLKQCTNNGRPLCRLIDVETESIPDYSKEAAIGTFLLFPGSDSRPLSSVDPGCIQKLVLLDCKWAKSSIRLHPSIACLPKVHLDAEHETFFWRWHLEGTGMLSTAEAVFYSAWEVATARKWPSSKRKELVYLLWIFMLQREHIREQWTKNDASKKSACPYLPFTEDAKEFHRSLRTNKRTSQD